MYRCRVLLAFIFIVLSHCATWVSSDNQPLDQDTESGASNLQGALPSCELEDVIEGAPSRQMFLGALISLAGSIFSPIVNTVASAIGLGPRSEPPPLPAPVVVPLPPPATLEPIKERREKKRRDYDSESDSDYDSGDDSGSDSDYFKYKRRRRRLKRRKSKTSRRNDESDDDSDEESQDEDNVEEDTKDVSEGTSDAAESITETKLDPALPAVGESQPLKEDTPTTKEDSIGATPENGETPKTADPT